MSSLMYPGGGDSLGARLEPVQLSGLLALDVEAKCGGDDSSARGCLMPRGDGGDSPPGDRCPPMTREQGVDGRSDSSSKCSEWRRSCPLISPLPMLPPMTTPPGDDRLLLELLTGLTGPLLPLPNWPTPPLPGLRSVKKLAKMPLEAFGPLLLLLRPLPWLIGKPLRADPRPLLMDIWPPLP